MRRSSTILASTVLAATATAIALATPASAQTAAAAPAPAPAAAPAQPAPQSIPRLIVAISVDQFAADLFAQYRQHYTGGLARLLEGAVYPSAYQSHAATETCPGHATLLTGVHPARSGIIANNWYDLSTPRAEKRIYCAEDERDPASSPGKPVVSAFHLKVQTLGERMKTKWPKSRNVAVSAKDRAVMMMGGQVIDEGYWWLGSGFTTFPGRPFAAQAKVENENIATLLARGDIAYSVPAWCVAKARPVQAGTATIGTGAFAVAPNTPDQFRVSPRMDAATLDLAYRLTTSMKLGKGPAPDLLSVSLSATDYIGHAFGHQGQEMCIQMGQLDAALGRFFEHLDETGVDYAVMLTADHGGLDTPERLDEQGAPQAVRVRTDVTPGELGKAMATAFAIADHPGPLVYADGPFGDYYVARDLAPNLRARAIAWLAQTLAGNDQVALALTGAEIAALPMPSGPPQDWTLRDRLRASYDAQRSGDVVALLKRTVVPIPKGGPGYTATHGSPWDYDRRVPLLFWRKGVAGFEQPQPVDTVDIAPTLAAVLGLPYEAGAFDGHCLDIDGGPANSCGANP